jgi:hypothetical protein
MEEKQACKNCAFWKYGWGHGKCRINPPSPREGFPNTTEQDWCGHWAPTSNTPKEVTYYYHPTYRPPETIDG